MNHRACPACGSLEKKLFYRQRFAKVSNQPQLSNYDVVQCTDCGTAYADDIPAQPWFDAYYREISKYTHDQRAGEESPADTIRFHDITALIAKQMPEKCRRIVDFGCATGGLLRRLKSLGYTELLGMDKSPASAEIGRRLHGIRIVNSNLVEIANDELPFDLLIQVGVLEHLCDLQTTLAEMRKILDLEGLMYIEVPDVEGFDAWPGAPFQQFSIEHINFFSRDSLTGLMERSGFIAVEVFRTARDHTSNTKMPVVCGFFRRSDATSRETPFDTASGPALRSYIDQSARAEEQIRENINLLVASQRPVIVWGVGTNTLHLMETTAFGKMNIVVFVDSNLAYQARELGGRSVLAPAQLADFPQPILISSQLFQSEIETQIRDTLGLPNETISLYAP